MAAIYAFVMIMPNTVSSGFATFVSLLPAAIAMMLYGVIWSGLKECKFNSAFIGTVIGIGSVLGYALISFISRYSENGWIYMETMHIE